MPGPVVDDLYLEEVDDLLSETSLVAAPFRIYDDL